MNELGIEKEKSCNSCHTKKELLYTIIDVFSGYLCRKCYTMKMLEAICEKLKIKNFHDSFWIKRRIEK